jgi:hypothetical protein
MMPPQPARQRHDIDGERVTTAAGMITISTA